MNCTHHIQNQISIICIAPHNCQCQRKLCVECSYEHEVDMKKQTVPINKFQDMVRRKLAESQIDYTTELTTQRMNFKLMLSSTQNMLKQIQDELAESIKQIYDIIEMEDKTYIKLINNDGNPTELSNTDLEKLVQIVIGKNLDNWNEQKNSYLARLEMTKNYWDLETKAFCEKVNTEIKEIIQLIKKVDNLSENIQQMKEIKQVYKRNEDLYQVLAQINKIDESNLNEILKRLKKDKITDSLEYLSIKRNIEQPNFRFVYDILKNISEIDYNNENFSLIEHEIVKKDLIQKIQNDKHIIKFLKFLVDLTAIDERFIQCGSNSLNILVEMKVDMKEQSFENIRIKNTTLICGNFVRCNFNGSRFDNVVISGMNLNGAQLFNCKWKNLKIQELNKLNSHIRVVRSVCFSPDSTTLASGSDDKSILLWDVKTGEQKVKLDGHLAGIQSVCFSPDGTTLASGSDDNSIRLWEVKTGYQQAKLDGHDNQVQSVCFSPNGTTLASGSYDMSIRLWDVKTGQQQEKFNGHLDAVQSVCFSPDGTTLASGSDDNSIRLWDVKTGIQISKLDVHCKTILSVCFSPDGTTLACGSTDFSIHLWDAKTRQQKGKLDGHSDYVKSVCFSPDSTTLATASYDKTVRLWNVTTGKQQVKLDGHSDTVQSVCFSSDGSILASCSSDKTINLWDVRTDQQTDKLDGHTSWVNTVCFSPDGSTLATGSYDKSIRIWYVKTGQQKIKLDGHDNWVQSVCFSPDGNTLASGSGDKSIRIWNVRTGQQKIKLDGHVNWVQSVCFSPDGNTLASGSVDRSIRLWNVAKAQQKAKLDGHRNGVLSVCFSPDGSQLVSGSDDKSILLWDVVTGQKNVHIDGHSSSVNSVCLSPDGTILVSGSNDDSIRLWDFKRAQGKLPQGNCQKDILSYYQMPFQIPSIFQKTNIDHTILRICQNPKLEVYGAFILGGDFQNYQGIDLKSLFKSKGSFFKNEFKSN